MENEIWKDIEGFEKYQISSYGRVKSLRFNKESILKPIKDNGNGYYVVSLYKNKKPFTHKIHRLVGTSFIPNPENKPEINHLNGVKSNNQVTNLDWVTSSENTKHGWQTGLMENTRKAAKKNLSIAHEVNKKPIYSKKLDMRFESGVDAAKYIQSIYFENTELEHLKKGISDLLKGRRQTSIFDYGWSYIVE